MKQFKTKKAFTLAEIIITILVIGIVAVMTIPTLLENNKAKQLIAAQKVLMTNIRTAMGNMQADEKLMGYKTTADFVNELQKYLKITQICDSSHLSDCFPGEFTAGGETKTIDDVKTSDNLGKSYTDDNVGIITVNGISAIVTYNPECQIQATNLRDTNTLSCLGMMYDLNAKAKPNSTSTDIMFLNVRLGAGCNGEEINGLCWQTSKITPVSSSIAASSYCQEQGGRLPTKDELKAILPSQRSKFETLISPASSGWECYTGFVSSNNSYGPYYDGVSLTGESIQYKDYDDVTSFHWGGGTYIMCVNDL